MLTLLRSNDPFVIAYAAYCALSILAGLVVAVMLVAPRWRTKLDTTPGTILFIFGVLGWAKLALFCRFLPLDLHPWSPTTANTVAIVLAAIIVTAVVVGITRWLKACWRGPRPVRRMTGDTAYFGALFGGMLILDFVEKRYQVPAFLIAIAVVLPIGFAVLW